MNKYPSTEDAEQWLANRKEGALLNILRTWLQAGLSISQCHQGLQEIGWPADELPSRATLGRKIKALRIEVSRQTSTALADQDQAVESSSTKRNSETSQLRLTSISQKAKLRPGFEDVHAIAESGAGTQHYDFS